MLKTLNIKKFIKSLFFVLSVTVVTLLLSNIGRGRERLFSIALSFLITLFVTFRFQILEKIFNTKNNKYSLFSIFMGIITSFYIGHLFYSYNIVVEPVRSLFLSSPIPNSLIMFVLILISFYALYTFYFYLTSRFYPKIFSFFKNLEKNEKMYLIISTVIYSIAIITIYSFTGLFYAPKINGEVQTFDVVYSSDTGAHGILNDYLNVNSVENDLRQPLFAVFSFPFAIIAYMIGNLFNDFGNGYFILIAIIQVFLLNIVCVIMSKMLNLKGSSKTLFMVLYAITYPFILFALNLEQYVFGLFYLFCFLYSYIENKKGNKYCFIASVGSLLTNGVFFPLLTNGKKVKQWFKDFIYTGLSFLSGIIVFGQFPIILNIFTGAGHLSNYISGKIEFNTFCQYSNFIKNCFIAPFNTITEERLGHISFQLAPIQSLSILGCILFILAILGFIINRKEKFAKICISWVAFSIILLIILGYGTRENGLILYSLYFNWAFVSLIFLLFYKLLHNYKKIFIAFMIILIAIILVININGLLELLKFGLQNFDHVI